MKCYSLGKSPGKVGVCHRIVLSRSKKEEKAFEKSRRSLVGVVLLVMITQITAPTE